MYDKIEWATVDDREKPFVECVRHGVALSCGAEDDLNCMRISGSLKKSTETGRAEAC